MDTKKCKQCGEVKALDEYYATPRGKLGRKSICKECYCENRRKVFENNPAKQEEERARQKKYREAVKQKVFNHYGEICSCCGETERTFLTLDHKNNDGAEHRRSLSKKGNARASSADKVWRDVIKNNFPDDFQVLCYNCNCGKRDNGGVCPHKETV